MIFGTSLQQQTGEAKVSIFRNIKKVTSVSSCNQLVVNGAFPEPESTRSPPSLHPEKHRSPLQPVVKEEGQSLQTVYED
jgi:hypothetical protein